MFGAFQPPALLGFMFESRPWVYKHGAPPALSGFCVGVAGAYITKRCESLLRWVYEI
jgi:hypothetical protein